MKAKYSSLKTYGADLKSAKEAKKDAPVKGPD